MKKTVALLFAVGVLILLVFMAGVNSSANSDSAIGKEQMVRLGLLNSACKPDNLPYLVAQENGYFDEAGVKVVVEQKNKFANEPWGDASNYASAYDIIVAGRAELYYIEATTPQTWKLFLGNVNTLEKTDYAILAKKDSSIENLASLKGGTIGLEHESGHAKFVLIDMLLEKFNLQPKDFKITKASLEDLKKGDVDALYVREPQLSLALQEGVYKIILDAPIVNYIMNPWPQGYYAVSASFLTAHQELAKKVIAALDRAVDFIQTNSKEANAVLKACTQSVYGVAVPVRQFEYWKLENFDNEAIQKQINLYHEKQLIPRVFNVQDIVLK